MPHKDLETRKIYQKEYYKKNKEKLLEYRTSWALENPEKRRGSSNKYARADRRRARFSKIKSRYGITEGEFYTLLEKQNYECIGCAQSFSEIVPHVDHNHETGRVRGLLCGPCNRGIGFMKENIQTMFNLIQYLKNE